MTDSSWKTDAVTGKWNSTDNWTNGLPAKATANFSKSSQTSISFTGSSAEVSAIEFSKESPGYSFLFDSDNHPGLNISGEGVKNNSIYTQSFIVAAISTGHDDPQLTFSSTAKAGDDSVSYVAGPVNKNGWGGGVISFIDSSSAGSAIFKVWTGIKSPAKKKEKKWKHKGTVGGEVSFSNNSTADNATFKIYGTLGTDGDTFGNVVFHDTAKASYAKFINEGGTVSGGDGGNTQFYGTSSADHAVFDNYGGVYDKVDETQEGSDSNSGYTYGSNGGDVAFDANATGGNGIFNNYAAKGKGSYGGVTSFNNNWPPTPDPASPPGVACSAGNGRYFTFGATDGQQGGGGHVSFSAKFGSATADNGYFVNFGSAHAKRSTAGHTLFSVSYPNPSANKDGSLPDQYSYFPTAGNATIYNHPATIKGGAGGYTEFTVFVDNGYSFPSDRKGPTAENSVITNLGAQIEGATGGYTEFGSNATADNAILIAYGGSNDGYGGQIAFYDNSNGGTSTIKLYDNGTLSIGDHQGSLNIGSLYLTGGVIRTQIGENTTSLLISNSLQIESGYVYFDISAEESSFEFNKEYTLMTYAGLSEFQIDQFKANNNGSIEPTFYIDGSDLKVKYIKDTE